MTIGFQQLINGHAWDFSSLQVTVSTNAAPVIITRFHSLNYEHSLTPGILRGTSAHKLARTRGQYESSGSMSIYKEEYDILLAALATSPLPNPAAGYMEKPFTFVVSYGEFATVPSTDRIVGCRITRDSSQNQQGGDPLMVDLDFDIMKLYRNGQLAVRDRSGIV